jgi:antitoxin ParD1/3/4
MPVSVDLGKPLEDYVGELVKSGRYRSRSEVLREGVRLVQEREVRMRALDALLGEAMEDVKAGRTRPAEETFAELRAELRMLGAGKRAG